MLDNHSGRPSDHSACHRPSDFYEPEPESDAAAIAAAEWEEAWQLDCWSEWAEADEQRQSANQEAIDSPVPFPELLEVAEQIMAAQPPPAAPPRSQPDAA